MGMLPMPREPFASLLTSDSSMCRSTWYKKIFIPHDAQFEYVDNEDVDQAIALISGDSPNVTVLINECFEASLLFIERKFGFQNVNHFLRSYLHQASFGPMFP
jgi:hypothetical protein